MKTPAVILLSLMLPSTALAAPEDEFLRALKRKDLAERLAERGDGLITAAARGYIILDAISMCSSRGENFSDLLDGRAGANATLVSCCATLSDGGLASVIFTALSPFMEQSLPAGNKKPRTHDEIALMVAEELLNMPIEAQKEAVSDLASDGVAGTVGICAAARR